MNIIRLEQAKDYLLLPERMWDGISPEPLSGRAVSIRRGLISEIIPTGTVCDDLPENIETIRLTGATLMPGLTDCHIHFSMDSEDLLKAIKDWGENPGTVSEKVRLAAAAYLANGVLAVRDGSDKMNIGLKTRNSINSGHFPGPLVAATGRAIFKKGSYGAFLGPGVTSVNEAWAQIAGLKADGIDQLKVVVSGLVSFKTFGQVGPQQFTPEELTSIVEKAHEEGLRVMAHASSARAVETAVKAGADSVEHGYFLDTGQLEMMVERGTAWIPTLAPLGNLCTANFVPYKGADMEVIRRSFKIQLEKVKQAFDMGVKLGIGTDAGANQVPHGSSYSKELAFYAEAGISTSDILRMASSVSAEIIGFGREIGTISPGKKPYLIAVPGDPVESLASATSPLYVLMPA